MKKIFSFSTFISLLSFTAGAQVVNEDVHFDFYQNAANCDLVNYFDGGNGLIQNQVGGITGGCLISPDSIAWGNDNAIYCSTFNPVSGDSNITSICFKYDSTTVSISSFQRAVSLFMYPSTDFNHYVIASISGNKKIEILSYGWNNNPYPNVTLYDGHWYRFELTVVVYPLNFQVVAKAELFDLGLTGTAPPVSVNSSFGGFVDNTLAADTSIQVSFTATSFGGAQITDDFHFHGGKGQSSCPVTAGIENASGSATAVYPVMMQDVLHIYGNNGNQELLLTLYDVRGKKMQELKTNSTAPEMNMQHLSNGIYYLNCISNNRSKSFRIALVR
jgi:hypothetical protein